MKLQAAGKKKQTHEKQKKNACPISLEGYHKGTKTLKGSFRKLRPANLSFLHIITYYFLTAIIKLSL